MTGSASVCAPADAPGCDARLRRVFAVHFDPEGGSPYWLARAGQMGCDPRETVHCMDDLAQFPDMTPDDLCGCPLTDFVPRSVLGRRDRLIVGQTGGTTGRSVWTAYREDEFHDAFVAPFLLAATRAGFPRRGMWLYAGPSGPHIIGKVARHLAAGLDSPDPFSVDFDPRWAKVLPDGSFARRRYVRHVIDQAMDVITTQPVDVLFTTPVLLKELAETLTADRRRRIRGVHYGGMALSREALRAFQEEYFPCAVHLSGYGNTLFGCCLEFGGAADRPLDYFPLGWRLVLEVMDDAGRALPVGRLGRVRFTRLDESMLLIRMRERDEAERVDPPGGTPGDFVLPGLRDPHPVPSEAPTMAVGLY